MKHSKFYSGVVTMLMLLSVITFVSCGGSPKKAETKKAPSNGVNNGHEYVDLGLSVKWATCNIGANTSEEYGDYYAWGETATKENYSKKDYKFYDRGNRAYNFQTSLKPEDDVATTNWGGTWRIPTQAEIQELLDRSKCTWAWTTINGVKGYKVISKKNKNSIFLPAGGCYNEKEPYKDGLYGYYWSSSLDENGVKGVSYILFHENSKVSLAFDYPYYGFNVRAVCE